MWVWALRLTSWLHGSHSSCSSMHAKRQPRQPRTAGSSVGQRRSQWRPGLLSARPSAANRWPLGPSSTGAARVAGCSSSRLAEEAGDPGMCKVKPSLQGPGRKQSTLWVSKGCWETLNGAQCCSLRRGCQGPYQLQQRGLFWLGQFSSFFERRWPT